MVGEPAGHVKVALPVDHPAVYQPSAQIDYFLGVDPGPSGLRRLLLGEGRGACEDLELPPALWNPVVAHVFRWE